MRLYDAEHAKGRKRPCGSGTELDAGPCLLGEMGAFEDLGRDSAPAEGDGSRKSADAATGNEHALSPLGHEEAGLKPPVRLAGRSRCRCRTADRFQSP